MKDGVSLSQIVSNKKLWPYIYCPNFILTLLLFLTCDSHMFSYNIFFLSTILSTLSIHPLNNITSITKFSKQHAHITFENILLMIILAWKITKSTFVCAKPTKKWVSKKYLKMSKQKAILIIGIVQKLYIEKYSL